MDPGLSYTVTAAYGDGTHKECKKVGRYNSFYALDFDLDLREPIYPVAEGRVEYTGWATGDFDELGKIVYIVHDYGGGKYQSLYAHLDDWNQALFDSRPGRHVGPNDIIGWAGSMGNATGPHLHFSLHENSQFQDWGANIGPHSGRSVLPEPFSGMPLTATGSVTLSFTAHLQGRSSDKDSADITIEVRYPGGKNPVVPPQVVRTNAGEATIELAGVVPGIYDLFAKAPWTLRNGVHGVRLESGENTLYFGTLLVGDIAPRDNPDNQVNSLDYSVMVSEWNISDTPKESVADFNGDGFVNSIDYSFLVSNFNKVGDGGVGSAGTSSASPRKKKPRSYRGFLIC